MLLLLKSNLESEEVLKSPPAGPDGARPPNDISCSKPPKSPI